MKNPNNPCGAPIGPRKDWSAWRARKDRSISKPRKNRAAIKLNKAKAIPADDSTEGKP
jgi:hypothetical protein